MTSSRPYVERIEDLLERRLRPPIRSDLRKTASCNMQQTRSILQRAASHRPLEPVAETFAISTELARGVRNAILLAGYEPETADIKATETPS